MVTEPLFVSDFFRIHHICQHGDRDARALPPTVDVRHHGCSQVATRYVTEANPGFLDGEALSTGGVNLQLVNVSNK